MIRHFVALRFKEDVTPEIKAGLYTELAALKDHIDGIIDFQSFANISIEDPLVRGFRDGFWFDFRDIEVRNAYLPHPEHQKVGAKIVEQTENGLDGVFVFDLEL